MDSFDNMMKAACHIKSHQMSFDKKEFEKLPEFYKTGLYCSEIVKNVHIQKDFEVRKAAFEHHRAAGVKFINDSNYDDAHYSFCRALCIFKYIKNKNKNWRNEGIKDEHLIYCQDEGSNDEELKEIKKMMVQILLNISLCDLNLGKFDEVRLACDEVIKIDQSNVKAYYRKAKSFLDCKQSVNEDYQKALAELDKALIYAPNDDNIKDLHAKLKAQLEKHKVEEKKIFKSFFRNGVDKKEEKIAESPKINKEEPVFDKETTYDPNLGKSELRILEVIIEQSQNLTKKYKKENNIEEMNKLQKIADQAELMKSDLVRLLNIDFDNPSEELRAYSEKKNLDLKNLEVRREFIKIRTEYLEKINTLYKDNIFNNHKDKEKDKDKDSSDKYDKKEESTVKYKKTTSKNFEKKNTKSETTLRLEFYLKIMGILILLIGVIIFAVSNRLII
jgi:hypothetical protein